jgi:phage host-nuclease inhibitor protein Gam
MRELCLASVKADELTARMNEEMARVRARYEDDLNGLAAQGKDLTDRLQAWSDAHPEAFASRKSVALMHGLIGYRTGMPTLKTLRGVTVEKVIAVLRMTAPQYIRREEKLDKEAILADREALGEENLRTMGLTVDQAVRFFAEPEKEKARAAS